MSVRDTRRSRRTGAPDSITPSGRYTPNGGLIEGEGVIPDVTVELPFNAEVDLQLEAAIEQLNFQLSIVQVG